MKVYLDTCCYNRPFDNQNQVKIELETKAKLYVQNKIRNKEYKLVWSFMLDYENKDHPYNEKKDKIQTWKNIATEFCDFHEEIRSKGKELEKVNIKPNDALHIACAIFSKCDYFLTTDYKLINKNIKEINIINPLDFVTKIGE